MRNKFSIFIFQFLILIVFAMSVSSCSWIAEDESLLQTPATVGDSEEACEQWVTGVYSKWIYDMFCWGYFPRVLEFDADYISGPSWAFGKFGVGNFQGESDVTDALWKGCYGLIGRTNEAARHISAMKNISDAQRNNALGELAFHRAFAYFLLVRAYGPVPIQPETESFDRNQPRQEVTKVYDYIIAQLEQATRWLYKNTDSARQPGHVSAGSAAGLLAKVYATEAAYAMPAGTEVIVRTGTAYTTSNGSKSYAPLQTRSFYKSAVPGYESLDPMQLYQQAADWAEELLSGTYGSYKLSDSNMLWTKGNANASEFLFSIGTVSGDAKYKVMVHTWYEGYVMTDNSDFIQTGLWVGCTRHWYDLFDHDDYRITKGVKHRWRTADQRKDNSGFYYPNTPEYQQMAEVDHSGIYADGVKYYYSADAQCLAFTTKYEDVSNPATDNADANWPFLRLADVILIYAEALNELDKPGDALVQLNKVRERSNADRASMGGSKALSSKELRRSAILEERAKELACEADRRWDLIRWGIYLEAMNAVELDDCDVSKTRTERNLLFPIPQQELNTNAAINSNNPGWQ